MGYDDQVVQELLERYARERSPELREQIVREMTPLVECVARKFVATEPFEDLVSEGFLGLLQAIEDFDPARGVRFSTYATHRIGGQIRHYLRDRGHIIRQPAWFQELQQRIQRATATLEQQLQREPTTAEIAAHLNLTEEAVEEMLRYRQTSQVLRMQLGEADDEDWYLVDPERIRSQRYVTLSLPMEDRIVLEETLVRLRDLERRVLFYFFYQELNQSEIARLMGISCNYVGHLLRKGLGRLREMIPTGEGAGIADAGVVDRTTGLYAAAYFQERLGEEISRAQRYRRPLAVCRFCFPPRLEEARFAAAAARVRGNLRRSDVAGRLGEREMGVILTETGAAARRVADRLAVQATQAAAAPVLRGVAVYPDDGTTVAEMLDAAAPAEEAVAGSCLSAIASVA